MFVFIYFTMRESMADSAWRTANSINTTANIHKHIKQIHTSERVGTTLHTYPHFVLVRWDEWNFAFHVWCGGDVVNLKWLHTHVHTDTRRFHRFFIRVSKIFHSILHKLCPVFVCVRNLIIIWFVLNMKTKLEFLRHNLLFFLSRAETENKVLFFIWRVFVMVWLCTTPHMCNIFLKLRKKI